MSSDNATTGTYKLKLPVELISAIQRSSLQEQAESMEIFQPSLLERIRGWFSAAARKPRQGEDLLMKSQPRR